ncbi:MAG: TolC family protein [Nitrospiraceae bacterium]|nr:TolC family protein [Nitrospiraceae bacterium]
MRSYAILLHLALLIQIPLAAYGEPLTLKECLTNALSNNPAVAEARLNVEAGEQGVASASGKHYPRLSLNANVTELEYPVPYIPAQSTTVPARFSDYYASWSAQMTVPLYQGGQIVNGVDLAKIRRNIQEQGSSFTRYELIANTVNTYNKILQFQKLREASQASVNALEEQHKNAQILLKVGRTARVDLLKVEVQLANEQQRLLTLDESLKTLAATLRFLMGAKPEASPGVPELAGPLAAPALTADLSGALAAAHAGRPEYMIARAGVEEANLSKKIATGKMLPAVNAFAGYQDQYGFNPRYDQGSWFVGATLSIPLFDRSLYADRARERLLQLRAEERLKTVDNQLRLDIETSSSSLADSRSRVTTAERVVEQADESFRIEQEKYRLGAGAMVDLLLAQAADITAVANYTQALYDYNAAVVAYRKATGTLEEYLK